MTVATTDQLDQLILTVNGGKDLGLVVGEKTSTIDDCKKRLQQLDFEELPLSKEIIVRLSQASKMFLVIDGDLPKEVYDSLAQYSTGQIEIYDTETFTSRIVTPEYDTSCFIILLTSKQLLHLQQQGFNIVALVGPTLQL